MDIIFKGRHDELSLELSKLLSQIDCNSLFECDSAIFIAVFL